ncbi:MAG: hypothetical protein ACO3AW_01585 [Chitinophagaceae bacterium]|jgi:hypothetical protein
MKKALLIICLLGSILFTQDAVSQCSICTKTAQQLGHKPAKGMNTGIIYLMVAPLAIIGVVGIRWWKNNKD